MKIKLWHLVFWGFIVFSFTDYLTTFLATSKHGLQYEANIIYTITGSFFLFMVFKSVMTFIYGWVLYKGYQKLEYPLVRYLLIYSACVFVFLLMYVSINNYEIYKMDTEEVGRPLTNDEKIEYYAIQMKEGDSFNPNVVNNNTNTDGNYTFLFNVLQFLCWRSFEKRRKEKQLIEVVNEKELSSKIFKYL